MVAHIMQILNIDPYNTNKILPHRIEKILLNQFS